jgi:predicted patatin/cPLA2 family phospholipase
MNGPHVSAVRYLSTVIALACLAACSAVDRPPATVASIIADGDAARTVQLDTIDTMLDRLARRALARGDRTLDILLLSGGGQHGAYGVGFLRGWRNRADAPMPRFDLVTGISTGALQAPFALLGTDEALNTAADLYRKAVDEFAPTFDWLFWLRRTGGLVETSRFQRMIETVFDERLCRQLRTEFEAGRQLAIATTDFDLGIGRVWDIGREMDCSATSLARVHKLLLATTAIPGIFPPVVIDGHVHADGGIVANLLPVLDFDGYRRLTARSRESELTNQVTVRLWVVMNLWTHPTPTVMDPADRSAMAQRGNLLPFLNTAIPAPRPARRAVARGQRRGSRAEGGDAIHGGTLRARHRAGRERAIRLGVDAQARKVGLRAGAERVGLGRDRFALRAAGTNDLRFVPEMNLELPRANCAHPGCRIRGNVTGDVR